MNALRLVKENGRREPAEAYTPLVTIYTAASCLRDGSPDSPGGCGAVIIDRNRIKLKLLAKYLGAVTNQQAEILACVKALEELRRPCRVEIFSDSKYVIDTIAGKIRMNTNRPFWSRLIENCYGHHITWKWVRGYSGVTFQEAADMLSRATSIAQTDLSPDDLDFLAEHLSEENNQLNIRSFEMQLDKVVSRYIAFGDKAPPIPKLDGVTAFPSAFSN